MEDNSAAVCGIDGQNWLYPVAYGVMDAELTETWTSFIEILQQVTGRPIDLVIHTYGCKRLKSASNSVFVGVQHKECMRHLSTYVLKKSKGPLFDDNL